MKQFSELCSCSRINKDCCDMTDNKAWVKSRMLKGKNKNSLQEKQTKQHKIEQWVTSKMTQIPLIKLFSYLVCICLSFLALLSLVSVLWLSEEKSLSLLDLNWSMPNLINRLKMLDPGPLLTDVLRMTCGEYRRAHQSARAGHQRRADTAKRLKKWYKILNSVLHAHCWLDIVMWVNVG